MNMSPSCTLSDIIAFGTFKPNFVYIAFTLSSCDGVPIANANQSDFAVSEDYKTLTVGESARSLTPAPPDIAVTALVMLDFSGSVLTTDREGLINAAVAFVNVRSLLLLQLRFYSP